MPWVKGQSGNPTGLSIARRNWANDRERARETRKSWYKLIKIRDDCVLERKTIITPTGQLVTADVVPSIRDLILVCTTIMDRAVGKPKQEMEIEGKRGGALSFNLVLQQPADEVIEMTDTDTEPKLIEHTLGDTDKDSD